MGTGLTGSATTAAVVRILGSRVDALTAAIREAITALEADAENLAAKQPVIDLLREVL